MTPQTPEEREEYQERMGSPEMEYLQYLSEQTPEEIQDTEVEEVVEEVAGHLQHLLTIAEGKEEIEQWNTHAANLINAVTKVLHHQLQKARQDWLREEIKHLQILKRTPQDCERCHACELAMSCTTAESDRYLNQCLQTIIDRYHSELDKDKV